MAPQPTTDLIPYGAALMAAMKDKSLRCHRNGRLWLLCYREYMIKEIREGWLEREVFEPRMRRMCDAFYEREYRRQKRQQGAGRRAAG